ncbi:serine/threonine-protein kinase [Frankia sp. R82]|uniref:serine/threonine-protein kinase n=1 Tax=Frankia sp. R82 TaxID=2950553 RepID=UPI0020443250|nr:serine/threonine protein kinase [Frankia sp. R82]MCM3882945.1 protein kinase [Frankia sp. R82]
MAGESKSPAVLVGGRYQLDGVLGRGGFGVVHRATDELLQRPVAVKEIRLPITENGAERDRARQRVLREARAAGRLHHPGAVTVLDVIDDGDLPWIVMEYVDGRSLARIITDLGARPVEETCQIGISLAYALEAAHRLGIVHRDVKPSNVLITADGQARLTDFGIAVSHGDSRLTNTGMVLGSPAYLPPERARGGTGSAAGDRWGLGAALFATVEGCPPYTGGDPISVVSAVMRGDRRPFRLAGPLAPLIDDLMSPHEASRPPLSAVRRRLRDILQAFGDPVSSRAGSRTHRPARPATTTIATTTIAATTAIGATVSVSASGAGTPPEDLAATTAVDLSTGPPDDDQARPDNPSAGDHAPSPVNRDQPADRCAGIPPPSSDESRRAALDPSDDQSRSHPSEVERAPEEPGDDHGRWSDGQPATGRSDQPNSSSISDHPTERAAPAEPLAEVAKAGMTTALTTVATVAAATTVVTATTIAAATTIATATAALAAPQVGGTDPTGTDPVDADTDTPSTEAHSKHDAQAPTPATPTRATLPTRRSPDAARVRTALPAARARITRPVERLRQVDRTRALGGIPARARLIGRGAGDHSTPAASTLVQAVEPTETAAPGVPVALTGTAEPTGTAVPAETAMPARTAMPAETVALAASATATTETPTPGTRVSSMDTAGTRAAESGSGPSVSPRPGPPTLGSPALGAPAPAPGPDTPAAATLVSVLPAAAPGPGRARLLVLVLVLAALASAATVAILLLISQDDSSGGAALAPRPGAATSGAAAAGTARRGGGTEGAVQNTQSTAEVAGPPAVSDPLATSSVVAVPPLGWASYTDQAAGWSLAYPADWRSQPGPGGVGNVDFMDPATGSFLRVGSVREANTSAIGDWRRIEASFVRTVQDYRRIRLTPSDGGDGTNQADWEFAYRRSDGVMVHVLNRGAIRNSHGYALYWHTREDHWLQDQPLMASLFGTFRPAP